MKNNFLFFLAVLYWFPLKSQTPIQHDTIVAYDILEKNSCLYPIKKRNVAQQAVQGKFYQKRIFVDSNLIRIEQRDSVGNLFDNIYTNSIMEFEYENNKVRFLKNYDKNHNKVEYNYGGYWSIEFVYDTEGKIIKEIFRNKKNELMKHQIPNKHKEKDEYEEDDGRKEKEEREGEEIQPAYIEFKYAGERILIREYTDRNKLISEHEGQMPCIPYIDCR